ncbi:MAG: hypothetical protein EP335_02650 [Alphaproteobacteria bacterium]|nr:MAG: hypothetical protein EP335_02650 [Alphaproteobacteria bacterium]
MKILALAALVAITDPTVPQPDASLEAALAELPSLVELCGEVPEAPNNVRRYNPIKPLQKSVSRFVDATEDRIACANDVFADTRDILLTVRDQKALVAIIDHVNKDFTDYFAALNSQSELLATRISHQVDWKDKTLVAPEQRLRSCVRNSVESARLCDLRNATFASHINMPKFRGRISPAHWEAVDPPQFVLE